MIYFQKPQLKIITNETINHFKKFISKLYKEEDSLLNKKKKREEIKQKNKSEKTRVNRNGINQYNCYQGLYMPPMQQINNQNPGFFNDYQNFYYYNTSYQYPPPQMIGFPPYFPQYMMEPPKNLQENLKNIYQKGIVNNIIGAFYIKECQEKQKNNEKRKVPVSMVEFGDEQSNAHTTNNNISNTNSNNNLQNTNSNRNEPGQIKLPFLVNEQINNLNMNENNEDNENKNDNINNYVKKEINSEKKKDSEKKEKETDRPNNLLNGNALKKPEFIY